MYKLEVGDKVYPISKSIGCSLNDSDCEWAIAKTINQPFLIVIGIYTTRVLCSVKADSRFGDPFLESDLIPYKESTSAIESKEKPPVWITLPHPADTTAINKQTENGSEVTIINTQEEANKLLNEEGNLVIKGDLKINCSLFIFGDIRVKGYIHTTEHVEAGHIASRSYIRASSYIKANKYLSAVGDIIANGFISASWGMESKNGSIIAKGYIKSESSIEAKERIKSGGYVLAYNFKIECKSLETKFLPFCSRFWSEMPPLKNLWKRNETQEEFRKTISTKEAKEICAWDGWHPNLRWQLEMFFGLKNKIIFRKQHKEDK